jgi:hypothetical protein
MNNGSELENLIDFLDSWNTAWLSFSDGELSGMLGQFESDFSMKEN